MPKHKHNIDLYLGWQTGGGAAVGRVTANNGNLNGWQAVCQYAGGDQPHNNMQPYMTLYMWKRTA